MSTTDRLMDMLRNTRADIEAYEAHGSIRNEDGEPMSLLDWIDDDCLELKRTYTDQQLTKVRLIHATGGPHIETVIGLGVAVHGIWGGDRLVLNVDARGFASDVFDLVSEIYA